MLLLMQEHAITLFISYHSHLLMIPQNPRTQVPETVFPIFPLVPFTQSPVHLFIQGTKTMQICRYNCVFVFLFGSLVALCTCPKAPNPFKHAGFLPFKTRKHCKNAGKVPLLETRGPKKLPTWPLESRLRGPLFDLMQDKTTL